ncbi:MAG: hydrogenase expression/formation protein HypE, partial [Clostridia bacterium]|nr:hydrogenase expression/formation protein HypE [Clostridia bacterium]
TDSFVVTPLFFKGGDIGRLAVCGTVNDLLSMGAVPKYLTAGFIIEEGLEIEVLERVVASLADVLKESGTRIVAADTKVIEGRGGLYINTSGIGIVKEGVELSAYNLKEGDDILVSGTLGDHHACILSHRMEIDNEIQSDAAPLNEIVMSLLNNGIRIRAMRDITRGGLATVLNEFCQASKCSATLYHDRLPVSESVKGLCGILGLDPLYMGNEGKLLVVVDKNDTEKALQLMRSARYGADAALIGSVGKGEGVFMTTDTGSKRHVNVLYGEGLPRIC